MASAAAAPDTASGPIPIGEVMNCFSCSSAPQENGIIQNDWDPVIVRDLYHMCMQANNGRLIVYGLFARANAVNNNRRLYPRRTLAREVKRFVKEHVKAGNALGELDHPSYSSPTFKCLNLPNLSHQVLSVKWKGNALWGFIEVLDTPSGRLIKKLYEDGHKLGVSSRGWASLREMRGKQYQCIMDNFELITFDFVTEPSTHGAWLLPYSGKYQRLLPDQRAAEELSRLGIGAVPVHSLRDLPSSGHLQTFLATFADKVQQKQRRFHVKRMVGPDDWSIKKCREGGRKPASEPAATDTSAPGTCDLVCPGMAVGCAFSAIAPAKVDPERGVLVPASRSCVLEFTTTAGKHVQLQYGAYVVLASVFGVPSQCKGLRDYWRHAYLFRERAREGSAKGQKRAAGMTPEQQQQQLDDKVALEAEPDSVEGGRGGWPPREGADAAGGAQDAVAVAAAAPYRHEMTELAVPRGRQGVAGSECAPVASGHGVQPLGAVPRGGAETETRGAAAQRAVQHVSAHWPDSAASVHGGVSRDHGPPRVQLEWDTAQPVAAGDYCTALGSGRLAGGARSVGAQSGQSAKAQRKAGVLELPGSVACSSGVSEALVEVHAADLAAVVACSRGVSESRPVGYHGWPTSVRSFSDCRQSRLRGGSRHVAGWRDGSNGLSPRLDVPQPLIGNAVDV